MAALSAKAKASTAKAMILVTACFLLLSGPNGPQTRIFSGRRWCDARHRPRNSYPIANMTQRWSRANLKRPDARTGRRWSNRSPFSPSLREAGHASVPHDGLQSLPGHTGNGIAQCTGHHFSVSVRPSRYVARAMAGVHFGPRGESCSSFRSNSRSHDGTATSKSSPVGTSQSNREIEDLG